MSAKSELFDAYESWRQWSEAEGAAIHRQDWARVSECQAAKLQLQTVIVKKTELAQSELAKQGFDWKDLLPKLRGVMNHLMTLETRNSRILDQIRQGIQAQKAEMETVGQNLRRVQRSYGSAQSVALQSYS